MKMRPAGRAGRQTGGWASGRADRQLTGQADGWAGRRAGSKVPLIKRMVFRPICGCAICWGMCVVQVLLFLTRFAVCGLLWYVSLCLKNYCMELMRFGLVWPCCASLLCALLDGCSWCPCLYRHSVRNKYTQNNKMVAQGSTHKSAMCTSLLHNYSVLALLWSPLFRRLPHGDLSKFNKSL